MVEVGQLPKLDVGDVAEQRLANWRGDQHEDGHEKGIPQPRAGDSRGGLHSPDASLEQGERGEDANRRRARPETRAEHRGAAPRVRDPIGRDHARHERDDRGQEAAADHHAAERCKSRRPDQRGFAGQEEAHEHGARGIRHGCE